LLADRVSGKLSLGLDSHPISFRRDTTVLRRGLGRGQGSPLNGLRLGNRRLWIAGDLRHIKAYLATDSVAFPIGSRDVVIMRPTLRVRSSRRQVSGFVLAHLGVASVQCNNLLLDVTLLIERRVLACLWRVDMVRLHALLA
jgi:hypothetical protein